MVGLTVVVGFTVAHGLGVVGTHFSVVVFGAAVVVFPVLIPTEKFPKGMKTPLEKMSANAWASRLIFFHPFNAVTKSTIFCPGKNPPSDPKPREFKTLLKLTSPSALPDNSRGPIFLSPPICPPMMFGTASITPSILSTIG